MITKAEAALACTQRRGFLGRLLSAQLLSMLPVLDWTMSQRAIGTVLPTGTSLQLREGAQPLSEAQLTGKLYLLKVCISS